MLRSLISLVLLASVGKLFAAEPRIRPNIVVIFADDLGYADIGPFGATKQKTPNLDRMAAEGMKLTSFYAAPVCSVSRAQLLTGCYGVRVSVPGVFFPAGPNGLHANELTIAEYLKPLGYATQIVGKWHLGDQPEFLPTRQGFDHYFGIPYSNDMQRKSKATGERVVPLVRDEAVEELLTDEKQSAIVERYTHEAVGFIRNNASRPFFLYMPHTGVHTPIHPGEKFRGKSENGRFGDWVQELDWSVGRVLDTIRDLKLAERTLVVFTSDNGPWLVKKADGGSATPLRGGKGSTWEGGVRVPTLAWWPGKIAAKSTCDAVAGTIDLLPTCASISGANLAPNTVIDGRDITGLLFGQTKQSPREAHYYFSGYTLQAVRQGPWKLALAPQPEPHLGSEFRKDAQSSPRLYNLDNDIGETSNLAEKHPEVVAKLKSLAEAMALEIGGNKPKARRPAGLAANPVTLYPTVAETAKTSTTPADLAKLKVGEAVGATQAPRIGNKGFTLSCTLNTDQKDTIILAHGGAALGYALHLRDGKFVFSVRTDKDHLTSVQCESAQGPIHVVATLAADGAISLKVGEMKVVTGKAPGPIPRQPQEDFCLGHDNGQPVATFPAGKPFKGSITDLRVTTAK